MARREKSWFFEIGNTDRFKDNDKPTQATFEELLESATFPTELEDRAKVTEAGLVKTTTDVKVNAGNDKDEEGISPCDFPTFVKPSQVPRLLEGKCIDLVKINRTTGLTPNNFNITPEVVSFNHNASIPQSTYFITVQGIAADYVDTVFVGVSPTPISSLTFTNSGGVLIITLAQGNAVSIDWIVRITMKSGNIYDLFLTLTHTPPGVTGDAILSNISLVAPPYSPDTTTQDGSEIEDWQINVNKECLDIPEVFNDLAWGVENKTITSVSYDADPCLPIDPCNTQINVTPIDKDLKGDELICLILDELSKSNNSLNILSQFLCSINGGSGSGGGSGGGTGGSGIEVGDVILSYSPPQAWGDSYIEPLGQILNRADFPDLFNIIGTQYGAGNGSTTFQIPAIAVGDYLRVTTSNQTSGGFVGGTGGNSDYVLTEDNIPAHAHQWGGIDYIK